MSTPLERAVDLLETAYGDLDDWQERKSRRWYAESLLAVWADVAQEQGLSLYEYGRKRGAEGGVPAIFRGTACPRCWEMLDETQEGAVCRSCLADSGVVVITEVR